MQLEAAQEQERLAKEALANAREQIQTLEAEIEDLRQKLHAETEARQTMMAESSVKAARLARLEGALHPFLRGN